METRSGCVKKRIDVTPDLRAFIQPDLRRVNALHDLIQDRYIIVITRNHDRITDRCYVTRYAVQMDGTCCRMQVEITFTRDTRDLGSM